MIHVVLPDNRQRRLPFYLAMEEWVAKTLPAHDYIFTWVVAPTVICGRNQDIEKEVNLQYCRENGIDVVRRRSGGGCVYADRNNIMVSFITPDTDVETTFAYFTDRIAQQLRNMGIAAEATGRNDIIVGGRKISGNAFLHLPGRSIVHGTMLFDIDREKLQNAITPSRAKLESKRVQSVESRIVTARELLPEITFDDFHRNLLFSVPVDEYLLTDQNISEIEEIEQGYYAPEWMWRKAHHANNEARSTHLDGVGEISLRVDLDAEGMIKDIAMSGDFFETDDTLSEVLNSLTGILPARTTVKRALGDTDIKKIITGLSTETFINLITDKNYHYGTAR